MKKHFFTFFLCLLALMITTTSCGTNRDQKSAHSTDDTGKIIPEQGNVTDETNDNQQLPVDEGEPNYDNLKVV